MRYKYNQHLPPPLYGPIKPNLAFDSDIQKFKITISHRNTLPLSTPAYRNQGFRSYQ